MRGRERESDAKEKTYALVAEADINTLSIWKDVRFSCLIIMAGEVTPANARAKPKKQPDSRLFPYA